MAEQGQTASGDATMTRIGQAVILHHAGDREEARNRLRELWESLGPDARPLHRATVARCLADTQDDPAEELAWDLRALSAVEQRGTPDRVLAALRPAVHVDLAAGYTRLRHFRQARAYLEKARKGVRALPGGPYDDGLRATIERVGSRLDAAEQRPGPLGPPRAEA